MRSTAAVLPLAFAALLPFPAAAAWRVDVTAPGTNTQNKGHAVATDGAGNVVAAGVTVTPNAQPNFTVVKLAASDGHELWRYVTTGAAHGVALDAGGDVYACGSGPGSGSGGWVVAKVSGADGTELWRVSIPGSSSFDIAESMALDAAGNPAVVGLLDQRFAVLALAAADGSERWRRQSGGDGTGIAIDGAGDVIATGTSVVKLAAADGSEKWSYTPAAPAGAMRAVAVDGNGDVAAAGFVLDPVTEGDFAVVKLAGADGSELWRRAVDDRRSPNDRADAVLFDPAGDVVAGGRIGRGFGVRKFRGSDGADVWIGQRAPGEAWALALDGDGNVLAAGAKPEIAIVSEDANAFLVIKYGAADGRRVWRRTIKGMARGIAEGLDVTADGAGNVIATGGTHAGVQGTLDSNFTVVQLDPLRGRSE